MRNIALFTYICGALVLLTAMTGCNTTTTTNTNTNARNANSNTAVVVNATPLTNTGVDGQGRLRYRMRVINGQLMNRTFERTAGIADVYRMMFTVKYLF